MHKPSGTASETGQWQQVIRHDGSFPGFLCAVGDALNHTKAYKNPVRVRGPHSLPELFDQAIYAARDDDRAWAVLSRLQSRLGVEFCTHLLEAFCSTQDGADEAAAATCIRAWAQGPQALNNLTDTDIALFNAAAHTSRAKAHLYLGIVRFSELSDGSFYAPISPDCDVLPLIAEHFAARFPSMNWIIHDTGRQTAVLHHSGSPWVVADGFRIDHELGFSQAEHELRLVWKRYHHAVAIEQRNNPKLQQSKLPFIYRSCMTEFQT